MSAALPQLTHYVAAIFIESAARNVRGGRFAQCSKFTFRLKMRRPRDDLLSLGLSITLEKMHSTKELPSPEI